MKFSKFIMLIVKEVNYVVYTSVLIWALVFAVPFLAYNLGYANATTTSLGFSLLCSYYVRMMWGGK